MKIYGWTYEADVHCPDCKHNRFGDDDEARTIDNEGNEIYPLYSWEITDDLNYCGDCFCTLM